MVAVGHPQKTKKSGQNLSYDAKTGRMTQYQFNVNGQSLTGSLAWNANGTLASLNITDPFNASDAQTCRYSYDDLARLAGANCGSAWSQTFSFDAFGNIAKTGSTSFQPTYDPTTNRMATLPGFTPSYDANGNVLNDSLHGYAWDAEGRPTTVDTVSVTYDALSRMVEQNRSGSYTEIVYDPLGNKLALMTGQTLEKAYVALPAGARAVYTSSGLSMYEHADWLGSIRLGSSTNRAVTFDVAYAPFGESYGASGSPDFSFAGMNQDSVAASYDALFREYGIQGRWPSPDPAGLAAVNAANPQSWNRYAYVLNNPLSFVDPLGLQGDSGSSGQLQGTCALDDGTEVLGLSPEQCAAIGGVWIPFPPQAIIRVTVIAFSSVTVIVYGGNNQGNPFIVPGLIDLGFFPDPDFLNFLLSGFPGGGGGGGGAPGAPQTQATVSPQAQKCMASANAAVQKQLRAFAGYAGVKLIGRMAIGAGFGAFSVAKFTKYGGLWGLAVGATIGAASGAVLNAWQDRSTIQKIENSYMNYVGTCMEQSSIPGPPQ